MSKQKILIELGLNNMEISCNGKILKHERDVYDFIKKYLCDIGGYDNFIFVGQSTTIELPQWLVTNEDSIQLVKISPPHESHTTNNR